MNSNTNDLHSWNEKNELERTLLTGLHGTPSIKADEKRDYLGVFREQVMGILLTPQVKEPAIYPEVALLMKDKRATGMILNGNINPSLIKKYSDLAVAAVLPVKTVTGPEYNPATGLVIASNTAVNFENISIEPRLSRLRGLGLDDSLIQAAGKRICSTCIQKIKEKAPSEMINYKELRFIDRLAGDTCPVHSGE